MGFHDGVADGKAYTETGPLRCENGSKMRSRFSLSMPGPKSRTVTLIRSSLTPVRKIIFLRPSGF